MAVISTLAKGYDLDYIDGTLGRPLGSRRKAADSYAQLLSAEPHATEERKHELRLQATRQARQSPLFFA